MTRREFLYYIWAASMALFMAETGGAILWFAYPRFKAGEFGGTFELNVSDIPAPGTGPKAFDEGRFWLVNLGESSSPAPTPSRARVPAMAASWPFETVFLRNQSFMRTPP